MADLNHPVDVRDPALEDSTRHKIHPSLQAIASESLTMANQDQDQDQNADNAAADKPEHMDRPISNATKELFTQLRKTQDDFARLENMLSRDESLVPCGELSNMLWAIQERFEYWKALQSLPSATTTAATVAAVTVAAAEPLTRRQSLDSAAADHSVRGMSAGAAGVKRSLSTATHEEGPTSRRRKLSGCSSLPVSSGEQPAPSPRVLAYLRALLLGGRPLLETSLVEGRGLDARVSPMRK